MIPQEPDLEPLLITAPSASLTSGSIAGPLLRLALPFAGAHLLNLATLVVDRIWIGRVGTEALAALGTAHVVVVICVTALMGMAMGTLAGVAQAIGRGDERAAGRVFAHGVLIEAGVGAALVVAAFFLPAPLLGWLGAHRAVSGPALGYLSVTMSGLWLQGLLLVIMFALQGAGEARATLRLGAVAPLVNLILDPLFIFTLDLGVVGAAWATVIAWTLAVLAGTWMIRRAGLRLRLRPGAFTFHRAVSWQIVKIGVPQSLEHLVRNLASFALVALITPFGPPVVSAYTSAIIVVMVVIVPGLALAQAAASLVGQNLGAGEPDRAWRTSWLGVAIYAAFMAVVAVAIYSLAPQLIAIFDANPVVVAEGALLLRTFVPCFPLIAVALVLSRCFGGAGETWPAMVAAAAAHLLVQIPLVQVLATRYGSRGAYWGMAAAFVVHGGLSAGMFQWRFRRWRAAAGRA